jgi:predicted ATPase
MQTCGVGPDQGGLGSPGARDEGVIRTPDRRLRVFVSSTLGELAEERQAVSRAVSALRLTPVMFEVGARPYPPAEVYQAYLAQADVFIGVYWQEYGRPVAGGRVSGLEEEFELSGGLPRLLYVKGPAPDREPRLADLLARIKAESSASYRHFRSPGELGRLVRDDLAVLLSERFAAAGGQGAAPAPRSARPRPLPVSATSLLGRDRAIGEVADLVFQPRARLVTLTGPGGVGKTRLAVSVGERLRDRFGAGTAFATLDSVTDPGLVLAAVGRAAGADLAGTGAPVDALAETLGDGAWLLILDNLEQVVQVGPDLADLLARCPGLAMLATSRTVLGLQAEREYPVPPLPLPADRSSASLAEVAAWPAVALFVDRARAVRSGFALTDGNASAVTEICRRLEGLPLAIELAAARIRLLDPDALLERLAASLEALGTGAVDLPERQRTLRATVEWSVGLLADDERSLLEVMAVFTGGWTIEAAGQIAGLDEDRALELSEALARHSLVYISGTGPRIRMLETIRAFVAERLAARPDGAEIARRHAEYYRLLAEQADQPLRAVHPGEWLGRLEAEAANLAAAVRWYLAHDRGPLPHLFRVLWLFWALRDLEREARSWVDQLLPAADTLDLQARAELVWVAATTAVNTGDDTAALAAQHRLEPLLDGIQDPFLHAASQLALSWTLPVADDYEGALRRATIALEELRGQDEPLFTAMAEFTAGSLDMGLGRYDDAVRRLRAARDLAGRSVGDWLGAAPTVQLGILAVLRGRLDEARALISEALDLSTAARNTAFVAESLSACAWLALADHDPEQAARLEGAADGVRGRVGLRTWSHLRRIEANLVIQIRERLGGSEFDQAFSAGSRLSQRQALDIARRQPAAGTQTP